MHITFRIFVTAHAQCVLAGTTLVQCTIAMAEKSDNIKEFSPIELSDFLTKKGLIDSKKASDELRSKSHLSMLQP